MLRPRDGGRVWSTREADRAQWTGSRPDGCRAVKDDLGCQQKVGATGEFDAE